MATFEQFAAEYASDILDSIRKDGFGQVRNLNESTIRASHTAATLQQIAHQIDGLTYEKDGEYLTESDKTRLYTFVAEQLSADNNHVVKLAVRAARNDDFASLVDLVSQIIGGS